jgi:hypothetical protein
MSDEPTKSENQGVSRRDFLRRAGREAAQTGAKIVPGAAIARVVLGTGLQASEAPAATEEETADGAEPKPAAPQPTRRGPIWSVLAGWRQKRMEEEGS